VPEENAPNVLMAVFDRKELQTRVHHGTAASLARAADVDGRALLLRGTILAQRVFGNRRRECAMLWTIFVILLVLWLLGMISSYTMGGFIHVLLILALAVVLIRVIEGRRPVL
jgi:hypothetical protein